MNIIKQISILFFLSIISLSCKNKLFVEVKGNEFQINDSHYKYIGCNYWYGGYLGASNKERLNAELDFLSKQNVKNLRVFICGEGDSTYKYRIFPSIQPKQRIYNEDILKGFDYFLAEASKRNMKIVFVLNNNWEWSGGFGQYLEWAGYGEPPLPKTEDWDWRNYSKYIAQFYSCDSCIEWNNAWIRKVINRRNTFNGLNYKDDPTIMAWELSNEPRPMDTSATKFYVNWVKSSAALIKSIDPNHLITIGTEGIISTFYSEDIYSKVHSIKDIDYCTVHLWPKTWVWYNGESDASVSDTTLKKTRDYIEQHSKIAKNLNKPLVIEEFGLHRDGNSFSPKASIQNRNKYYDFVFDIGKKNDVSGYNFWGFAGVG